MEEIMRLSALHEIQQLAYGYAHAFALRDRNMMRSLWAPTREPSRMPVLDRARIEADLDRWWARLGPSLLHVTNHLITFDDDSAAHGHVHCLAEVDTGDSWVDQSIIYRDRYVRHDGRWLFATREHCLWYGQERATHPLRQPPARWPRGQVGAGDIVGREQEL